MPAAQALQLVTRMTTNPLALPRTLLVPTDFGDASGAALRYAVELARKLDCEVVLMHAFEIPIVGFPDGVMVATAEITNRILEGSQTGLTQEMDKYRDSGVRMRGIVKQGSPWEMVAAAAEEVGAGMIVMGTHGRRGIPRALIGSVAEKVVRTCPIPVLTVHCPKMEAVRRKKE